MNKEKVKLLLLLVIPGILGIGMLSHTCFLWKENRHLETDKHREEKEQTMKVAFSQIEAVAALISNGRILEKTGAFMQKEQIRTKRFTPFYTQTEGEWKVYTGKWVLSGTFISLVKMLEFVEKEIQGCKVVSVTFGVEKNNRERQKELEMTVFLQQPEKIGNTKDGK